MPVLLIHVENLLSVDDYIIDDAIENNITIKFF